MSLIPEIRIDPELFAGFLEESEEYLLNLDSLLLQLETDPHNQSLIEAIFRPVHSLKGNAAFFAMMAVKELAHTMESLLDAMRKGRIAASHSVIDTLLAGLDELKAAFSRARAGDPEVADRPAFDALLARINATITEQADAAVSDAAPDWQQMHKCCQVLQAEVGAANDIAQQALAQLRALIAPWLPTPSAAAAADSEPGGSAAATVATAADPVNALLQLLAEEFDDVLDDDRCRQVQALLLQLQARTDATALAELVAEIIDGYETLINISGFDLLLREFMLDKLAALPELPALPAPVAAPAAAAITAAATAAPPGGASEAAAATPAVENTAAGKPPAGSERPGAGSERKTMRVAESNIDTFLHYVGELVVVGDMFNHLQERLIQLPGALDIKRDFRRGNETFAELSSQLQHAIMAIRRVPVSPVLQKMPRLIRDVATQKGKNIVVELEGEDTLIDKSLLELLDAPLAHMCRNAADHGIEKPAQRRQQGKSDDGHVVISVNETRSSLLITVSDDGAGLDLPRLRAKAESLGIIAPGSAINEEQIINLLFSSGVSTAETVTDISGRGVGMDVVKRSIEEAGGSISVHTESGKGSRFELRLPKGVTTQIMPGYLVRVLDNSYVLPLDRIQETFSIDNDAITRFSGMGECIIRHGKTLPLACLRRVLFKQPSRNDAKGAVVVSVTSNRRTVALLVDSVIGVQKVVVRSLEGLPSDCPIISGGALMGDGSVALILNADGLEDYLQDSAIAAAN